ncbi:MAG: NAD(P)/FAD-dependent oxidoreductase [candidate division Zixibacteria bacterium]|nr:NAD(P)/FAD-dependent oxidoreductase [candidate division Zixibacteria bacterium]
MKPHYQIIIIGAGPAGGNAARIAAEAGLDVLLVERDERPGLPLCCAEGISVAGLGAFIEPDPVFIANEINGLKLTVAGGKTVSFSPKDTIGYVLDRPVFESYLVDEAVLAGTDLLLNTFAKGIKLDKGQPAVIELVQNNTDFTIEADFVIAADGVESQIGKMAGLKTELKLKECETAIQYRVSGIEVEPSVLQFFVGQKYSPNGYIWVFPKSSDCANIGVGLNPGEADNAELRGYLDSFISENYPLGKVDFVSCGNVPKFIGFEILGKENLFLAGDAARLIDSLSGAGIARALHTGKIAAETILEGIEQRAKCSEIQRRYRKTIEKEIGWDMRVFQKAYPIVRKFTEADWNCLAEFLETYLKNQKAESVNPAALIKSALTTAPGLLRLARHIF